MLYWGLVPNLLTGSVAERHFSWRFGKREASRLIGSLLAILYVDSIRQEKDLAWRQAGSVSRDRKLLFSAWNMK